MIDGRHYHVDYTTFSQILGFGEEHRTYSHIHDELRAEIRDIRYMWRDSRAVDGKRSGCTAIITSSISSSGTPSIPRMEQPRILMDI
jgi:hypothetical protein